MNDIPEKWQKVLTAIEDEIRRDCGEHVECVSIYTWPSTGRGVSGLRVAEVSYVLRSAALYSGASYMQCDETGLQICAAVERYAIARLENWSEDETTEAREMMRAILKRAE